MDSFIGRQQSSCPDKYLNLTRIAKKKKLLRISGNEPTICWDHLMRILELVEQDGRFKSILETNGILIGGDRSKARDLSKFRKI